MFSCIQSWLGYFPLQYWYEGENPERVGMRHHIITPYGPFETSDGEYVNIAVLSDADWKAFCEEVIERPSLLENTQYATNEDRMQHREEFESLIEDIIISEPRDYWADRLDSANLPWGDVNDVGETLNHPQTEHLGIVQEMDTDHGPIKFIDNPVNLEKGELKREPMPDLGEHTEEVLTGIGFTSAEIDCLREDGVI
jgi:crotonobetainyl-CoA:carnitine CoA-transferase CaiB-like acyl-CoA transferase